MRGIDKITLPMLYVFVLSFSKMLSLIIVCSRRSMLPVPPAVGPPFSFDLDVEDGEVENYEVGAQNANTFKE